MNRIELFKQHLDQKCAVKIISGINNFDIKKAEGGLFCQGTL